MASASPTAAQRDVFGDLLSDLTTVFTPPCSITWLLTTTKVPSQFPAFPTTGPASCDPPEWGQYLSEKGFAYYSPAICPSGFEAGCSITSARTGQGFPPVTAGETAMYCVPSGFTCTSDTTDFRGGVWGVLRTTTANGAAVTVGPAIQIRWQEGDLSNLATDPLTPGLSPTQSLTAIHNPIIVGTTVREIPSSTSDPTSITSATVPRKITISPVPAQVSSTTMLFTSTNNNGNDGENSENGDGISSISSNTIINNGDISSSSSSGSSSSTIINNNSNDNDNNTSSGKTNQSAPTNVSSTSVATMALSGILMSIMLTFLVVAAIRRYRRYRAGEVKSYLPFRLGKFFTWKPKSGIPPSSVTAGHLSEKADAELDAEGPIPELGPGVPLGTKENPAELVGSGVRSGVRNSWMSQVSRMFTVKKRKEVSSV